MKQFLVIIFMLVGPSVMAETYYVTFVKGAAKIAGTAKNIAVGDKLNDKDQVVFIDKAAKISCISPVKGRFDITSDKSKQNAKKEWVAVLTDLLVPSYSGKQLSTRSLGDQHDAESLFKTNHPEHKVLLIEDVWIDISNSTTIDKKNFFFFQYDINGKPYVKKVSSKENAISFNRSLLNGQNGEVLSPESVALCYQSDRNGTKQSKIIARFSPVFISEAEFNNEVSVLKKHLANSYPDTEKLNNEIYNHFYGNYGFVNPSLFRKWLK